MEYLTSTYALIEKFAHVLAGGLRVELALAAGVIVAAWCGVAVLRYFKIPRVLRPYPALSSDPDVRRALELSLYAIDRTDALRYRRWQQRLELLRRVRDDLIAATRKLAEAAGTSMTGQDAMDEVLGRGIDDLVSRLEAAVEAVGEPAA